MKVKDITSITDINREIIVFIPSEHFNSDKQNSCTQSKNYTAIHHPRFHPNGPKMDTLNLEVKSIEPDIYEYDIPALNIYTK